MTIPDFQTLMLPVLRQLEAGERTVQELHDTLAAAFSLTADDLAQRLPSGRQFTFANRLAWTRSHLKGAGLLESPKRGVYRITERGRQLLAQSPPAVGMAVLMRYPEYVAFRTGGTSPDTLAGAGAGVLTLPLPSGSTASPPPTPVGPADTSTPDDLIEEGYRQLRTALVADLRERIAAMSPSAFEQLVVDVLTKMGYGGGQANAALVVGGTGDEGIDGVIKQDKLGLESIYLQAKRWQGSVGRPEIQRFAGALQGQRARKGVFITTSSFTREAQQYAASIQTTIVLVDGAQLAELMIDHGVAVTPVRTYEIKRVDSDYFAEA